MGSGKSTVANMLRGMGYDVLDADEIVHQLLGTRGPGEKEIYRTFGEDLRGSDGKLDRRALGRMVFGNSERLAQLEAILHPLVRQLVSEEKARLAGEGKPLAFYDVPLLFEKKMEKDFDHVLVVTAPEDQRRRRLATRSQMSDEDFVNRSKHHMLPEEKAKRASYVVVNDSTLKNLEAGVLCALAHLNLPAPTKAQGRY